MIAEICFTAEWLDKKRKELKGVDPSLFERALEGHLVDHRFDQQAAKIAAAKAGLLAQLILTEAKPELLFESQTVPTPEKIRPLEITGGMHHLNRLKAINPEAFWYWYQASGL